MKIRWKQLCFKSCWIILPFLFLAYAGQSQVPQKSISKKEQPKFLVEPKVKGKPLTEEEYLKEHNNSVGRGCKLGPDFGPYMNKLQKSIQKNWKVEPTETRSVVLTFKIASCGEISDLKISKTSGSSEFDEKALNAVKKSEPIPLPDGAGSDVTIQYTLGAPQPNKVRRF